MYSGFQYRAMRSIMMTGGMGAVWFKYEISPIKVHYTLYSRPLTEFLVHLCAIIGGTFAAAGIIESLMRNGVNLFIIDKGELVREVSAKEIGKEGVELVPQTTNDNGLGPRLVP